jgi:ribosomal protein L29
MKKTQLQELIKQGSAALLGQITTFKTEHQKLKLEAARGELKNPRAMRNIRRSIAQLNTALTLSKIINEQS